MRHLRKRPLQSKEAAYTKVKAGEEHVENSIWKQIVHARRRTVRNGAREVTEARPRSLAVLNKEYGFYSQCHGKPMEHFFFLRF